MSWNKADDNAGAYCLVPIDKISILFQRECEQLSIAINFDERSVRLFQSWHDEKLNWDPDDYNGLKTLRMPCKSIWLPDIVTYNRFVSTAATMKNVRCFV